MTVIKEDTGSVAELFTAGLTHLSKTTLDNDELVAKMSIMMMIKHTDLYTSLAELHTFAEFTQSCEMSILLHRAKPGK